MKLDVDELNIDQFETVPADSSKLINEVNNIVVKKTVFHELVMEKLILLFIHSKMARMAEA